MTPPRKLDLGFRRGDIEWLMRSVFYQHNRFPGAYSGLT